MTTAFDRGFARLQHRIDVREVAERDDTRQIVPRHGSTIGFEPVAKSSRS